MRDCQHEFIWCEERKRFQGKKTDVTIRADTPLGTFAIMAFAKATHSGRGGSSFATAGGRGILKVKHLHEHDIATDFLPTSCLLASATICGNTVTINHHFERDGNICVIPGDWSLGEKVCEMSEMRFIFEGCIGI